MTAGLDKFPCISFFTSPDARIFLPTKAASSDFVASGEPLPNRMPTRDDYGLSPPKKMRYSVLPDFDWSILPAGPSTVTLRRTCSISLG